MQKSTLQTKLKCPKVEQLIIVQNVRMHSVHVTLLMGGWEGDIIH